MARIAAYDRTKVLEAAMKLFWARGYSATSLPDLLQAMEIARSSFYASFGSKRLLFIECLELFADRTLELVLNNADMNPAGLTRTFFETTIIEVSARKARQGCMMVNTVLELADVDAELHELAKKKLSAIESAFANAFEEAQDRGELSAVLNPQELAQMVMTINLGLRVQCRQENSKQQLHAIVENSLSVLGLAA